MRSDLATLWRLLRLTRPYRRWTWLAGFVACVTILSSVGLMMIAGWFIAAMAIAGATTGMMNYFLPAAGIRLFAILRTVGRYLDRLVSHEATFRLLAGLRLWLFGRLARLAPSQLEDRRAADLVSGLQADVDTLQHAYLRLAAPVVVAAVCSTVVTAVLVAIEPRIGLVVFLLLACAGVVAPAIARRAAARPGAEAVAARTELRSAVVDALQGALDLRAAGATGVQQARIEALSGRLIEAQRRAATSGALAEASVGLCAGLALWIATLLAAGSVAMGQLPPPMLPAIALAALAAFEAVAPMPAAMQRWGEVMAAARRVFALADQEPAITDRDESSPVPQDGSLVFTGVRLRYGRDTCALDGLDLAIPSGQRIAILGPSGAGKSSIARLLLRFCAYEGEIRLGGHDLRQYRAEDLRRLVGVAAQQPQLLNGSIRGNLLIAAPEASDAALHRALETAQLSGFVAGLPDGIDSWIGEAGTRLSAGQARRLAVAQVLLRDPSILILDEPTENLDAETARQLLAAVMEATPGRTVIIITHDEAAASVADRVIRVEAGRRVA